MPHGFDLEPDLHAALRGPVPPDALRWVERATGAAVRSVTPLEGGNSAAVHRITLDRGDDVVLQRFVLDWIRQEPWLPADEVRALELLRDARPHTTRTDTSALVSALLSMPVPAPLPVAADPDGTELGVPTVLMTAVPGRVVWDPEDLDPWLDGLVATIVGVHAVPAPTTMRDWETYPPVGDPRSSSREPGAWDLARRVAAAPPPPSDRVLLHRDYHPGNVLWSRDPDGVDRVSGVVDWVSACAGPPEQDIAHCRVNLALHHGQAVADDFLDRWLAATGRSGYDTTWDLLDAVSMAGDDLDPALDAFVITAARGVLDR